jgi:hypothetical protein
VLGGLGGVVQEKNANVAAVLRKARMDAKLWGRREKRAKDKREGKTKKVAKEEEGMWRLSYFSLCFPLVLDSPALLCVFRWRDGRLKGCSLFSVYISSGDLFSHLCFPLLAR